MAASPSRLVLTRLACLLVCGVAAAAAGQTRTLRIVTYNIEADTGGYTGARSGLIVPSGGGTVQQGGVLEGIGEEILGNDPARPIDILALQETTSNPATVLPIANALSSFYNAPGMYGLSSFQATSSGGVTSGGGPSGLVYNTTTVQLIASVPVDPPGGTSHLGSSSGEYREVMRYEFAPAGVTPTAANEFYIYVSHYKAGTTTSDKTGRAGEAQIIRSNSAALPSDARILYVGDYNVTGSSETGYQTIVGPGANRGIDPGNPSGATGVDWEVDSLLELKSESATDLRYRDDLLVMTTNVYYGAAGGLALVPGTYHVFGNNGTTPYDGSVDLGNTALTNLVPGAPVSAAALYTNLTTASDHLPVVADFTIPIPPPPPVAGFIAGPTNGAAPLAVTFTNLTTGATNYSWVFGDGNTSALTNPAHVYAASGVYSVTLTATGAGGTNTLTRGSYVVATTPPPPPNLKVLNCLAPGAGGFQFTLTNANGTAITPSEQSRISIYAASNSGLAFSNWLKLTNSTALTNGAIQVSDPGSPSYLQRFYRAVETP